MTFLTAWYGGLAGALISTMIVLVVQLHRLIDILRRIYFAGILTGKVE